MTGCLMSKQINVVPMNMKVIIFLGLLAAVHCLKDDKWQRKTINQTDDEVDVEISDESGNAWSENNIFEHEGYEVVKPKNRNVCLIRQINDTNTCFDEQLLNFEPPPAIQTHCDTRQIILLNATECDDDSGNDQGNSKGRKKRQSNYSTCCRLDRVVSSECASDYCCRRNFWGRCKERCCTKWTSKVIWTKKCVTGYENQF